MGEKYKLSYLEKFNGVMKITKKLKKISIKKKAYRVVNKITKDK